MKTTIATCDDYIATVEAAQLAAGAYYDTDVELMIDSEYDALIERIADAETAHPDWIIEHGLLTTVAAGTSAGGDVIHPTPMLSLDKVTDDLPALQRWIDSVGGPVVVEPKLDGMAVRAVYRAGRLTQVVTRGDGTSGEDVTAQAVAISGLPEHTSTDFDFEVRGEVYLSTSRFAQANAARVATGQPPFANSRNAIAGSLRSRSRSYPVLMSFAAYDADGAGIDEAVIDQIGTVGARGTYSRRIDFLHQNLFGTAARLRHYLTPDELAPADLVQLFAQLRAELDYPIDGVVIKADLDSDRARLGAGSRAPKWALAFKFPAKELTAVVQDIEVSIGRTGRLALRARITPTVVNGSTVTYASLHNVSWLTEQDIRIGDTVIVKKAGDVIPRVESPILDLRPAGATAWLPPETDPAGNPWDKSTLLWRSTSPELSVAAKLIYAASRDALDIEGMSTAIIEALVADGAVTDLADLLALTETDLADLATTDTAGAARRIGASVACRLAEQITRARTAPLARLVTALGIRGTGRSMSRRLAAKFPSLDALRVATAGQLESVDGIGSEKAKLIVSELATMSVLLDKLAAAGASVAPANDASEPTQLPLVGMTVVITGSMKDSPLAALDRNEMNELIESNGGKSSGSVSAKTSLLVCGEEGSAKWVKATDLGIRIVTPVEFAGMVGIA